MRCQPADRRTEGTLRQVVAPVAPLLDGEGNRQREVLFGDDFRVLAAEPDRAWGYASADGYLGWIAAGALGDSPAPTHRIAAIRSYAKATPRLKRTEPIFHLSFGSRLAVGAEIDGWAEAAHPDGPIYLPAGHLAPLDRTAQDPASVAGLFVGTPYLWGGNSAFGIDCSGLVQIALTACGIDCPRDSDMQAAAFDPVPRGDLRRGDLVFWKGHVGMLLAPDTLIHANAHHMAVAIEPLDAAIGRIGKREFGAVTGFSRPRRPPPG